MCLVAPAPASWLRAVPEPPHVSCGSGSQLLTQGSSRAAMCPMAPTLTSWLRAAPEPPHVTWLQLPPPGSKQLRSHRVSPGSSSRLLAQGSSGAAMCPMALALTS
jgi:hypothetical protein